MNEKEKKYLDLIKKSHQAEAFARGFQNLNTSWWKRLQNKIAKTFKKLYNIISVGK